MKEETLKILTADAGKVFKRVSTGEILGEKISFDLKYSNILDYLEIDKPLEESIEIEKIG